MKFIAIIFILTVTFNSFAQVSWCQLSYRHDSFGRGVESVFNNEDTRGKWLDEGCYRLGQAVAKKSLAENSSCRKEFSHGYVQGKVVSGENSGEGCFSLGYVSGIASLGTGARENDSHLAGLDCIKSYWIGQKDGKEFRPASPSTTGQPEYYCYQLGYLDGQLFQQ